MAIKIARYSWIILCIFLFKANANAIPIPGATVDLTTETSSGFIGSAYFEQIDPTSTGTGVISAFLSIQQKDIEKGYNTDGKVESGFNMKRTGSPGEPDGFTRSLLLSEIPIIIEDFTADSVDNPIAYRQFLLDVNENSGGANEYISLDQLQLYLAADPDLETFDAAIANPLVAVNDNPLVYNMDAGNSANWIALNYALNAGSGSGDMFAYIPDSLFTTARNSLLLADPSAVPYVYLYSLFGAQGVVDNGLKGGDKVVYYDWGGSAGFEEWAVLGEGIQEIPPPQVPEPTSLLLLGTGIGIMGLIAVRRKK